LPSSAFEVPMADWDPRAERSFASLSANRQTAGGTLLWVYRHYVTMTSLAETYGARGSRARKRLLAGTGLFLAGALLIVTGIVVASTGVLSAVGVGTVGAREIAGIVAGLGVPAVFVGVFTVLPASRRERAAAAIGAAVAIAGVVLFRYAYPDRWAGAPGAAGNDLTFAVLVVYFLGTLTTFWVLFTSVVNVRSRSPGGTVTLQRIIRRATGSTSDGIQRPGSKPGGTGGGSVGIGGGLPDESRGSGSLGGGTADDSTTATSDGGSEGEILRTPEPSPGGNDGTAGSNQPATPSDPDRYCGSCAHFDYVRTDRGIQPYCGFHDELMDDMEPCEQWEANTEPVDRGGRQ
jgi:hypothetical protein